MKKYILIAASLLALTACNEDKKNLELANRSNDSLRQIVSQRDAELNDFISSFNDIENNLHEIAVKQQIIGKDADKSGGEIKGDQKTRMNSEITAINKLMDENKQKIAELNRQIKNSRGKNKEFQKLIATLNEQLAQKSAELEALNERLNSMNAQIAVLQTSVDTLNIQNMTQARTIAEGIAEKHTAYYIVGKSKDLQEANVIDKEGGVLGMGKTAKLSDDFETGKFTRIDYTKTTSIEINGEAKIVTSHPIDSYAMEKVNPEKDEIKSLTISDPEKFWSASKYLVIVKK